MGFVMRPLYGIIRGARSRLTTTSTEHVRAAGRPVDGK
jgi:hypothetical protein